MRKNIFCFLIFLIFCCYGEAKITVDGKTYESDQCFQLSRPNYPCNEMCSCMSTDDFKNSSVQNKGESLILRTIEGKTIEFRKDTFVFAISTAIQALDNPNRLMVNLGGGLNNTEISSDYSLIPFSELTEISEKGLTLTQPYAQKNIFAPLPGEEITCSALRNLSDIMIFNKPAKNLLKITKQRLQEVAQKNKKSISELTCYGQDLRHDLAYYRTMCATIQTKNPNEGPSPTGFATCDAKINELIETVQGDNNSLPKVPPPVSENNLTTSYGVLGSRTKSLANLTLILVQRTPCDSSVLENEISRSIEMALKNKSTASYSYNDNGCNFVIHFDVKDLKDTAWVQKLKYFYELKKNPDNTEFKEFIAPFSSTAKVIKKTPGSK